MAYRVAGLLFTSRDFKRMVQAEDRRRRGVITLHEYERIMGNIARKYGYARSEVIHASSEAIRGRYECVIFKSYIKFERHVRGTFRGVRAVHYLNSRVVLFTLGIIDLDKLDAVAKTIAMEQEGRWGYGLELLEISTFEDIIPEAVHTALEGYLDQPQYLRHVSDPNNWKPPYKVPRGFRISEHVCSYYQICGIEETLACEPEKNLQELLSIEDCCEDVYTVSESLYVFSDEAIEKGAIGETPRPRCRIWKKGGWGGRPSGTRGRPPTPPRRVEERRVERPRTYPNPLAGKDLSKVAEKFRKTLRICQLYGLNPIPIAPNSKMPLFRHAYLRYEPIKDEHFKYFYDPKYNIGIYAGYNNLVIVDIDVKEKLDVDTLSSESPRGYHYYFFVDEPFYKVYTISSRYTGETVRVLEAKDKNYCLEEGSVVPEGTYKWIRIREPLRITKEELEQLLDEFIKRLKTRLL